MAFQLIEIGRYFDGRDLLQLYQVHELLEFGLIRTRSEGPGIGGRLEFVGVVEGVVGQSHNTVDAAAEIAGGLEIGNGDGGIFQRHIISGVAEDHAGIDDRADPATGAVQDQLGEFGGFHVSVRGSVVEGRRHGERTAAGVEDDVGGDLLTADEDLRGIVTAITDIGNGDAERFGRGGGRGLGAFGGGFAFGCGLRGLGGFAGGLRFGWHGM